VPRLLLIFAASIAGLAVLAMPAAAQEAGGLLDTLSDVISDAPAGSDERAQLSGRIIQLLLLFTLLSIAPGLLIVMTSFTRFVIVLSILRSALGLNQTPPNMVLAAIALFLTYFVMQPVLLDAWENGLEPLLDNAITEQQAVDRIGGPFKDFMYANARPKDLELFVNIAARSEGLEEAPLPESAEAASWRSLVPAFMISELRRAFTIGFIIYLPFVAIDLIVASILMSAGMMMLPPVLVSLPFKVIFFVLIDGWYMVAGSMMESYLTPLGG
jgi:flagellar biosynthetic protein FliP